MGKVFRYIGRRIFLGPARKIRWISRIVTVIGITRFVRRTIRPAQRVILAPDEQMEVRISKRDRRTL